MTTPDLNVDADSAESLLEAMAQCLVVDEQLNEYDDWHGFVSIAGLDETQGAQQAWRFVGEETLPTPIYIMNPALNPDILERLRELTADPERGKWQTWIALYDRESDTFEHTFLWPGEDAGFNVLGYDTPMATIETLNPAFKAE